MNEPRDYCHVIVTLKRGGGNLPDPAVFAAAVQQAASQRDAAANTAHAAKEVLCAVTVNSADSREAVAVALDVTAAALRCPAASSSR